MNNEQDHIHTPRDGGRRLKDQLMSWEVHFRTLMMALVTAGIVWLAGTAAYTQTVVARLDERLTGLSTQLSVLSSAMKEANSNAMPRAESRQRFEYIERRLDAIETQELRDGHKTVAHAKDADQ